MNKLDDIKRIKNLDKSNMIGSIEELYLQCQQTWDDIQNIKVPPEYKKVKNIVVVGMGGSALGPHVIQTLYFDKLKIPIQIINDYHLPAYTNEETLVVLSSNSGTTEEVLCAAEEAKAKKSLIMGMATGGKLADFLNNNKIPSYIFEQKHNPSRQPRMGIGYMILGMLGLFHSSGLIELEKKEIHEIIGNLKELNNVWGIQSPQSSNIAKKYARDCFGKIVIIVSSSFFIGNVHTFNNQLNENSKTFSAYFTLPEINHHLMEGLGFPKTNPQNLIFIFINSPLFDVRIKKRFKLTEIIVKKNGIKVLEFIPKGSTKLIQAFEVLLFGSYIGFYLAMLNNLNPASIPWVDYFKKELAK
jgi:glucose/mannose-6-phosphate isomerase